jgi:5,10-methylenetetrahydrofolate reductase
MTQPVYDPRARSLPRRRRDLDVPVLVGILPLASHKNAEFLHNEVPGMSVPERDPRAHAQGRQRRGRSQGRRGHRPRDAEAVKDRVHGAYIMPPFGRFELALRVIDGIVR